MSLLNYMTRISLTGPMKSVNRVLNAAKKNLGTDQVIDRYIALPDLLDGQSMQDSLLREKKRHFDDLGFKRFMLERKKGENDDEEYLAYLEESIEEDYSNGRMIVIVGTGETERGFEIEFELWEEENCPVYSDWLDWSDIARVYGCTVFEDLELYRNGDLEDFRGSFIYEPAEGEVKETHILPQHNLEEYTRQFNRLKEINPGRYRPLKVRCLEEWIRRMKNEVNREKVEAVRDGLKANGGRAVIPDGITFIPGRIFAGCDELTSIYIPDSVSGIGACPFDRSGLASIEVATGNPHFSSKGNCLLDKEGKTLLFGCRTSVIPDGVEVIAEQAFEGCPGLKEIVLPSSVREIGNHAFGSCENLSRVALNAGLDVIGSHAFLHCKSLEHIIIPDSVTTIYAGAFRGCTSLKEMVIPEGVTGFIINSFEDCTSLERVVIPESITEIGGGAFRNCTSLKEVILPERVIQISSDALDGCPCREDLISRYPDLFPEEGTPGDESEEPEMGSNDLIDENGHAVIPDGATEIEECAFADCRNLVRVDIPGSVKVIEYGAFYGCTGLTSIVIPEGVEEIQEVTFRECTALTDVSLPESLKSVSSDAFDGCPCEEAVMRECEARSIIY